MRRWCRPLLSDLEDFWAVEFPAAFGAPFEPLADVVGYRPSNPEELPTCHGFPVPADNALYCERATSSATTTRACSLDLYAQLGDVAVATVIAHEYGHAVQERLGLFDSPPPTVMVEQQADCLAGAWLGSLIARGGSLGLVVTDDDLEQAIAANLQIADPIGLPSMTPGAHGSGFDRLRAFSEGMDGGVASCSNYIVRPPDLVELPFDVETASTQQSLDSLVPATIASLERFWGFVFPELILPEVTNFGGDQQIVECDATAVPTAAGGAVFCQSERVVHYDTDAQQTLWLNNGDAAATYPLVHAWTQAVVPHFTDPTSPAQVVVTADCLAGVWYRRLVDDYERVIAEPGARPRYSVFLTAGDIDEILAGLLLAPTLGPDGEEAGNVNPFERAAAFGDGFLEGEATCVLD